jgi:large subunit ribosomal protein L29
MPTGAELRELDEEELEGRLSEYRRELLNLRFQLATGQLDNVTRLSRVRKDLARVLTIMRDREIALAEGRFAGPVAAPRRPGDHGDDDELETPRPRRRRAAAQSAGDEPDDVPTTAADVAAEVDGDIVDVAPEEIAAEAADAEPDDGATDLDGADEEDE